MKTWDRGRKKATPEQKAESMRWQNERVRIANLIARKPEIQKICCICENEGKILHNRKDPYYITFICDECRKDPNNLIIAEESRFDLRTKLDKANLCMQTLNDEQVQRFVLGYMNERNIISLGDYCKQIKLSRHQFNQIIKRYNEIHPNQRIEERIKAKTKKVKSEQFKKMYEDKTLI